jgi:hypothetical protein
MNRLRTIVLLILVVAAEAVAQPASVTFLGMDVTTLGNWKGVYGQDGFVLSDYSINPPAYSGFNGVNANQRLLDIWSCSADHTCDPREPLKQPYSYTPAERVESYYYSRMNDDFQINSTDGNTHRIALYFCDYEFYGRQITVVAHNTNTGAVLDTRVLGNYSGGAYLVYNYTGNVDFQVIDNIVPTTDLIPNGTISGFFWGGSGGPPSPAPSGPVVGFSPLGVTSGSTVSGTVPIQVSLDDVHLVQSVQLQLDGVNLGAPMQYFVTNALATPVALPFNYNWDTTTTTNCTHTLTAVATDGTNPPVSASLILTVNNGPPNCGNNPPPVSAPTFSPAPGTYTTPQQVTLSTTTAGASIRYTTDGVTTPTETVGTLYVPGNPISITSTTTIKAIAYESGMTDSSVSTAIYTINSGGGGGGGSLGLVQSNATASQNAGTTNQIMAFNSSVTPGNTIFVFVQYYNSAVTTSVTDGCNDQFSRITGAPVSAGGGTADWFIAKNVNGGSCPVIVTFSPSSSYGGVAIFEVSGLGGANVALDRFASGSGNGTIASVSMTPSQPAGFAIGQIWSDGGGGAAMGGSWTTQERTRFSTLYQSNMAGWQILSSTGVVSLSTPLGGGPWIATIANFYSSSGGSGQVAAPAFTPAAGPYTQPITISTTTPGATIRYTTDNTVPTETHGTVYSTPVTLTTTTTIEAIAYKTGMTDSSVSTATYTVSNGTVATPIFNPLPGPYSQPVAISTTTPGAAIRYTTDGTAPTETHGTVYSTPISLSTTTTIKAIAYETNFVDSAVALGTYTVGTPPTNGVLVQSNATTSVNPSNASQSVAFTSNITASNTIFVFAQYYGAAVTATASDTCGDAFQEITGSPVVNAGSGGGAAHWFLAKSAAGGACTVSITYSSPTSYGGVAIFEVSGLGGLNVALDRFASATGNGSTASASITPAQPVSFAIAQIWSDGGGGFMLGGSWTTQERTRFSTIYQSNMAGWQALTSTAVVSLSTPLGGGPWIAMIANFYAQ